MPLNRNTLIRLRTIDACLIRRNRLWTVEDLRQACEDALIEYEGIDSVSLRTIQRDIELMRSDKLGYNAPIIVKDRKYYMYDDPDYSITQLPLSQHDLDELAQAMDILRQYRDFSQFNGTDDILTRLNDRINSNCRKHEQVIFLDTNLRLKGLHFISELYDHIVNEKAISVCYQSYKAMQPSLFHLSPYLLKEFNNRWFVVGYVNEKKKVMTLALDRIIELESNSSPKFRENTFFERNSYFDCIIGVTRDINSKTESIVLKFDKEEAPYVETKPIHSTQTILAKTENGEITINIQVCLNLELERLIIGFADHVEVIAPKLLRHRIAKRLLLAGMKYQ